ncbi:MAG: 50S ribosomal protein L6 [Ignavibacteriales bacterium]|nr:50S ribosomal protein L6 [Ignavibacteriales bacterium]
MSRIGRKPIPIVKGINVTTKDGLITVKGPKGELSAKVHPDISVEVGQAEILLTRASDEKQTRALHGLWRALLQNMITGVTQGYSRKLEIVGVGYRAEMKGKKLHLLVGYSHPILFGPPEGVALETPTQTNIIISGIDKQLVGLVAAKIRSFRPPEPYKGKGIKYEGEYIRRKAGKAAATGAK